MTTSIESPSNEEQSLELVNDKETVNDNEESQSSQQETNQTNVESPQKRHKSFHVSTSTPVHSCPKECGFGLCHSCFVVKSNTVMLGRRRGRGQGGIECPGIHEEVNMLKEMTEPAYFFKSYVERKANDYKYPKRCAVCGVCLVIEGK